MGEPVGLRTDALARARARGLQGWDAYDAAEDETAAGPSDSLPVEEFMRQVEQHASKTEPTPDSAEIGEPVSAPPARPMPSEAPQMPPPDMPRMPKPPAAAPPETSADRLARAFEQQNSAAARQGVSDALYAATAATPLQSMKTPELGAQSAMVDQARAGDAATAQKAAMSDPKSPASMRARAILEGTEIGRTMKARLGPRWDSLTAASLPEVGEIVRAEAAKKNAGPGATGALTEYQKYNIKKDQTKKTEDEAQLQKDREQLSKALGIDLSGYSRAAIDDLMAANHTKAIEKQADSNYRLAAAAEGRRANDYGALARPIPFGNTSFRYAGAGTPRAEDVDKVQTIASDFNAALSGMDQLEQSLRNYVARPGPDTKGDVESKVVVVSTALNKALGQGAQAENEAKRINAALGADLFSPTGIAALVQSVFGDDGTAARTLTTRLGSVRSAARATAAGKVRAFNFQLEPRLTTDGNGNVFVDE